MSVTLPIHRGPKVLASAVCLVCAVSCVLPAEPAAVDSTSSALEAPESIVPFATPFLLPEPAPAVCEGIAPCSGADVSEACCIDSAEATRATPHHSGPRTLFAASGGAEYRIPSLVRTDAGALIALAEKRFGTEPDRDSGHIQTVYRVRPSVAAAWGPERILCDLPGDTCGNPTAVYDREDGAVYVLMNSNPGKASLFGRNRSCLSVRECRGEPGERDLQHCPDDRKVCMRSIEPGDRRVLLVRGVQSWGATGPGLSWTTPEDITAAVQPPGMRWDAVGPGAGIQLDDGRLVFGAKGRNIFREHDGHWTFRPLTGSLTGLDTGIRDPDESTVVQRSDGSLYRNDRATGTLERTFRRVASRSLDASFTSWTPWSHTGQPVTPSHRCEPRVCGPYADTCEPAWDVPPPAGCTRGVGHVHAGMGRYSRGPTQQRLMFTNPGGTRNRAGLAVRLSYDEGDTWPIGRQVVPITETGGYTATAKVRGESGWGIGVLLERSGGGRHWIDYHFMNLAWILCGRPEPLHIGGNAWLGTYTHVIRSGDGRLTYHGSADGIPVRVRSRIDGLRHTPQRVQVSYGRLSGWATVDPAEPDQLVLDSGRRLHLDAPGAGRGWCDTADGRR